MISREEILHKQIVAYLKYQYPKVLFNTDMSGVKLSKGLAGKMSSLRSEKGHPDLAIYEPRNGNHGLFIELKAEGVRVFKANGDIVSDRHVIEQAEYLSKLHARGYVAKFAIGFDEAKAIIDKYLK